MNLSHIPQWRSNRKSDNSDNWRRNAAAVRPSDYYSESRTNWMPDSGPNQAKPVTPSRQEGGVIVDPATLSRQEGSRIDDENGVQMVEVNWVDERWHASGRGGCCKKKGETRKNTNYKKKFTKTSPLSNIWDITWRLPHFPIYQVSWNNFPTFQRIKYHFSTRLKRVKRKQVKPKYRQNVKWTIKLRTTNCFI